MQDPDAMYGKNIPMTGPATPPPVLKLEPEEFPIEVVNSHYTDSPERHEHVSLDDVHEGEPMHVWGHAVWTNGTVTPIVYTSGQPQRLATVHHSVDWHYVTAGTSV